MPRAIEVTINGRTYPSIQEAAEHLGVNPSTVCRARHTDALDYVGLGFGTRVKIGGQVFPSIRKAAEELGCCPATVSRYLDKGEPEKLKNMEPKGIRVTVMGVEYSSIKRAGELSPLSRKTIYRYRDEGRLDEIADPQFTKWKRTKP